MTREYFKVVQECVETFDVQKLPSHRRRLIRQFVMAAFDSGLARIHRRIELLDGLADLAGSMFCRIKKDTGNDPSKFANDIVRFIRFTARQLSIPRYHLLLADLACPG